MFPGNDNNPPAKLYTRYSHTKSLLNRDLPPIIRAIFKRNLLLIRS